MSDAQDTVRTTLRTHNWRLVSEHQGEDNDPTRISCELEHADKGFVPFVLSEFNSPFLNFLQSVFTCQLAYLRMNAAERGIQIARVEGELRVVSDAFRIQALQASFTVFVRDGEATEQDLREIGERCLACPISRNLEAVPVRDTRVRAQPAPNENPAR